MPARRINKSSMDSADTALRLARYFRTSEWFWMNLQIRCGLEVGKTGCTLTPAVRH